MGGARREGVILNKDGSFQRTAKFRGPDLDSSTPAELVAITSRLNNALRRLGSGWAIFIEAQRQPAHSYPIERLPRSRLRSWSTPNAARSSRRKARISRAGYFLTLLWLPPADDAARAEAWLYENRAHDGADWRAALDGFVDRTDRVLALVEGFMPEAEWLDDGETLTYLHSCVSTRRQRVRVPETPMYLDAILVDEDLTGGLEPRLGRAHLRTLTIMGFPSQTWPGLLDDLNRLAFPYRWATRAICLDKTDATKLLGKIRRQWFAKRKSIMAILKEVMTNEASVLMDSDAANKAIDADAALQELGSDLVGEAYVTATDHGLGRRRRFADERLRLVEKTIQGRDFTCMRETVNAIEAWLGSLPGHVYANVRQPPISTLNLAHMMPFSAVWAGPERDEHFRSAAALLRPDRGLDAVPVLAPCRRRRPHPDRRADRRRQVRPAGADGAPVPPLSARPGLRFRFRRVDPSRVPRDGRRLARPRRRARRRGDRAGRLAAARVHRRCRRARLGRGMGRGAPRARSP